jgi:hypothetical protein
MQEVKSKLYKSETMASFCYLFGKTTMNVNQIHTSILGGAIDSLKIDSDLSYAICMSYSNAFAYQQLQQLADYYKCDDTALTEIKRIAKSRNVSISAPQCDKQEEGTWVDMIIWLAGLLGMIWLIRYIYKKVKNGISKWKSKDITQV